MMRFLYVALFMAMLAAGCGDPGKNGASDSLSMESQSVMLSGLYADTVPGERPGRRLYIEVALNADSTFVLTKYTIIEEPGSPTPKNGSKTVLRGLYLPYENWSRIKLTSAGDNGKATSFQVLKDALRLLDSNEKPYANAGDYDLARTTRAVSTVGDYLLSYDEKVFSKYPAQVFVRTAGNHIRIHKPYLDQASQLEKALVSLYALQYNSGCDQNGCAINTALNMNEEQMKTLVAQSISEPGLPAISSPVERQRLTMLLIAKIGKGFQVHYAYLTSSDENYRGIDEYSVEGNMLKRTKNMLPEMATKNK